MNRGLTSQRLQLFLACGIAIGIALLLNKVILMLFGQKSAARAEHSLVGIFFLMVYAAWRVEKRTNTLSTIGFFFAALIPCYLGTVFPDLDITLFGIGGHRNPFFHSSLSFFLLWVALPRQGVCLQAMVVGYGVGLASHLWWDVLYFGNVVWLPGGTLDRLWLGGHGLLCFLASEGRLQRLNAAAY